MSLMKPRSIVVVVALAGVARLYSLFDHPPNVDKTPSETILFMSFDTIDQNIATTLQHTDYQTLSHWSAFHQLPHGQQVQVLHVTEPDASKPAKSCLVLMTVVFGVSSLPPYIPMFLCSIQESGANGVVGLAAWQPDR